MANFSTSLTEPIFTTSYRVIYADTDAGGVVYNANYLRFFEIGRSEMMRAWAISYSAIEKQDFILPVTESYIRYKAPARYDDLITIATSLVELKNVSIRFHYRITHARDGREQLLCKGFTKHACVNRQGRLAPFPDQLKTQIKSIFTKKKS